MALAVTGGLQCVTSGSVLRLSTKEGLRLRKEVGVLCMSVGVARVGREGSGNNFLSACRRLPRPTE